jgi:hypothetical protein
VSFQDVIPTKLKRHFLLPKTTTKLEKNHLFQEIIISVFRLLLFSKLYLPRLFKLAYQHLAISFKYLGKTLTFSENLNDNPHPTKNRRWSSEIFLIFTEQEKTFA